MPSAKLLSVCAFVPYPLDTTPSQRFRLEQWRPRLEAQGVRLDFLPFADARLLKLLYQPRRWLAKAAALLGAFGQSAAHLRTAARYDAVVVHRAMCIAGPAVLERLLAKSRRPMIFDFDDTIYQLHTSAVNRWFGWLKFPRKTATICRLSSHVVVGNSYLADYARQFNRQVTVVPTSIDTERYRPAMERGRAAGKVVMGWTGSATSQTHLEQFAPVLRDIVGRLGVELRVISNREPELPGIPHVWRQWTPDTEVEELRQFDFGIMPMPDDPWARGKCALKALQYMAMGIPPICSPVGANCEVVRHGENGLLASTPEEWLTCTQRLVDDPAFRARLGTASRRTVETQYSADCCAERFVEVVRTTLGLSA
jgi:glycosyltransferase involved in cell wall biosynthesis